MRVVFLDRDTIGPAVELNRPSFAHEWQAYPRTAPDDVAERLRTADIAITNKAPIGATVLDAAPNLKMIAVAATGYDCVDVAACRARGVVVANVRGYATTTVPEHVFALLLALRRSIIGYKQDTAQGAWGAAQQFCFFAHPIGDLRGAQLGIVGNGALGRAVAAIAQHGFGMQVAYLDHARVTDALRAADRFLPLEELLATSDCISLHCPLTSTTEGMFGIEQFRAMRRSAIFVNTARGALVQEAALVAAIEQGLIAGAGVDVLAKEPPPDDHPYMSLMARPNFLMTPHVAWASDSAMQTLWGQVIGNIENFRAGNPSNTVA